jgi:hypothetical protein
VAATGARIGVVVCDDNTLVFSPTPQLSAADGAPARMNALFLASAVFHPMASIDNKRELPSLLDENRIVPASIAKLKEDLEKNPAQAPAAAEIIRVFNAFFEFVELKLEGTAIERRTVPIPTELMGLSQPTRCQSGL